MSRICKNRFAEKERKYGEREKKAPFIVRLCSVCFFSSRFLHSLLLFRMQFWYFSAHNRAKIFDCKVMRIALFHMKKLNTEILIFFRMFICNHLNFYSVRRRCNTCIFSIFISFDRFACTEFASYFAYISMFITIRV